MEFNIFNSLDDEKDFFGKFYPWFKYIMLSISLITIIGSISALALGLTDSVSISIMGPIVLLTCGLLICLRLLYLGIMKILHFDYNKIAEFFKDYLIGLFAISSILLICYIMFQTLLDILKLT